MSTTTALTDVAAVERIQADHAAVKRMGHWTEARRIEVRARRGAVVLDLRSPNIPDEVEIHLELQRAMVKLLLPEDAGLDHWDLRWSARGKVKDHQAPAEAGARRVRLTGTVSDGEIRIHRGGVAIVSAMLSREYLDDLRAANREGRMPIVDDPSRTAN
ncbi:hypothetical protein [Kitasatospora sp. NPDC058190]|jgi:hypothetical protein|uniref:hypothetical protein n=1 Tax=Kitasatospora sp. NPDC058190 TaxID=3346371 RepID=UPI0036DCC26F